jgi:hypothetical protein
MVVRYFPAANTEAANLLGATLQKARAKFCNHPVTAPSEANCDDQVRASRSQAPDHTVKPDEFCQSCHSNVQEEIMAMVTNHIIPDVARFLCTGCGEIISFIGDPLQQCSSCDTSFRVSISTLIGVSAPAILSTAERGRNITTCSTDTDEEKLNWMTQLLSSIVTLLL